MTLEIGALRFAHFEAEASWAAGWVGPGLCIPFVDCDLREKYDKARPSWFLNWPKRGLEFPRRRYVDGSINIPMYAEYAEAVLDFAMERDTIANGYDLLNSWAIKRNDVNGAVEYAGLKANRLVLSASATEPELMASVEMIGKSATDAVQFSRGALPVGLPYLLNGADITWYTDDLECQVQNIEVTVENNLQLGEGPLDDDYRMCHLIGGFEYVSFNVTMLFDSVANRTRLRAQSEGSLVISFTNGTTSPQSTLTITIPKFTLDEIPEDLDPEGITAENIPVTAVANASGDQITYSVTP